MKKSALLGASFACLAFAALGSVPVSAQSQPGAEHIAKARAEAFKGGTWNYPELIMCYPHENHEAQQVIKNPPATKAFDNVYNVGIGAVTAWAITTSDGIILIDTLDNTEEAQKYIVGGLKSLGLDPMTIKDIVITHGHGDHYGGARYLQDTIPGVKVYMSQSDYALADKNAAGPRARGVAAPKHDQVVTDGQKLTLGDETLTLFITPGHTPGTISMLVPVKDHGTQHLMFFWGGTASGNDSPTQSYTTPELHKAYDQSSARVLDIVKNNPVDGLLSNHPSLDDSDGKLEHLRETPDIANPFITGKEDVLRWVRVVKECNLSNTAVDAEKDKKKNS